jgi:peptidoglycan/xylan/chitin deacetylase (PgdA/CDA1 family)
MKKIIKELMAEIYYNSFKKFSRVIGNRTLIYHAFGSKLKHDTYGISIDIKKFEDHIRHISDHYKIINIYDSKHMHENTVSVTIDDGYKDNIDAIDILSKYNIPFTLFISPVFLNTEKYLSSDDVKNISLMGNSEIGTHGHTHTRLSTLDYEKQLDELSESKKILESLINSKIDCVSYPHGSYNSDTLELVKKTGYRYAASSIKGINTIETNDYLLKRIEIISSDSIKSLDKKIKGYYDYYQIRT